MAEKKYIIVLDDDPSIAPFIETHIGMTCLPFTTNKGLMKVVKKYAPVAAFIDINLKEECGLDMIPVLSKQWDNCPIFAITASDNDEYIAQSLKYGAIDFIKKPISKVELKARFFARCYDHKKEEKLLRLSFHDFEINFTHGTVKKDGISASISAKEQKILELFHKVNGEVLTKSMIKTSCWGQVNVTDNAVNRRIFNLRKSLKEVKSRFSIVSLYGKGFVLKEK